ncbi:MAG: SprT family zinc-dependent metalloprotease [Alphaproteobacteria bacterium]|nr:SprT family zinc-dependent metalloprotease [Alphaproteobacteria bacterium]
MFDMHSKMTIGSITADLVRKRIKHINVRIYAQTGRVRIAAPHLQHNARMTIENIRAFALSKLGWILKQQTRMRRIRVPAREKPDPDVQWLWGKACPVVITETHGPSRVLFADGTLKVLLRPKAKKKKQNARLLALINKWQKTQLTRAIRLLLDRWEPVMGIEVARVTVLKMKTRWGSCTPGKRRIRINLELLKHPPEYLEYVLVHELCHFFERGHGPAFKKVMDKYLPNWRELRTALNNAHIN